MDKNIANEQGAQPVEPIVDQPTESKLKTVILPIAVILLIVVAGFFTGRILSGRKLIGSGQKLSGGAETINTAKEVGIKDTKTFRDSAEGKLVVNDDKNAGEGTHKLLRAGGKSQTAYLTSSVIDLNEFVDRCVQVWGETFTSQKVGWFMDVGRAKILASCPEGVQ